MQKSISHLRLSVRIVLKTPMHINTFNTTILHSIRISCRFQWVFERLLLFCILLFVIFHVVKYIQQLSAYYLHKISIFALKNERANGIARLFRYLCIDKNTLFTKIYHSNEIANVEFVHNKEE